MGDRLARTGKTIGPKQYAFRRLLTVLIIMLIVSGLLKKSLLLGAALGIILGAWLPLKLLQRTIAKQDKAINARSIKLGRPNGRLELDDTRTQAICTARSQTPAAPATAG